MSQEYDKLCLTIKTFIEKEFKDLDTKYIKNLETGIFEIHVNRNNVIQTIGVLKDITWSEIKKSIS